MESKISEANRKDKNFTLRDILPQGSSHFFNSFISQAQENW